MVVGGGRGGREGGRGGEGGREGGTKQTDNPRGEGGMKTGAAVTPLNCLR